MKELIAFIGMAIVIAVLIEINERRKARKSKEESQKSKDESQKSKEESQKSKEDCDKEQACAECGLVDICEKESKKA